MATPPPPLPAPTPLARRLAAEIRNGGPMPFDAFMGRCLYDPEHGYYAAPERRVGRRGDFHTSVSVGPVFGELLAAWAHQSWRDMGCPAPVALVEQGAHDGQLMADVLAALAARHPYLSAVVEPVVVEPQPARRAEQRQRLTAGPPVSWRCTLEEMAEDPAPHALFFANELLDAFPVARWRFDGSGWNQLAVALAEDGAFAWHPLPAPGFRLPGEPAIGGETLPAGYETETCPGLGSWTGALARAFGRARVLLLDYGREADDYFAPHRTAGTLRGYHRHRRCDDPFAAPGETDLTADVNFSHLAAEARRTGFRCLPPERQGAFLTRLATPRLLDHTPPGPAWLRQFQTLTHPNQLGHLFHAVVLDRPGGP